MSDGGSNVLVKKIADYYRSGQYDARPASAASAAYGRFVAQNYPDSEEATITEGVKFNGLSVDQIIYFGLFMASKGDLKFD